MDFFFEDLPSTSQATPEQANEHEQSLMSGNTGFDSAREKTSGGSMTGIQEQHSPYRNTCNVLSKKDLSINDISRRAQEMVEKINLSRASDQKVMDSFQDKLQEKVAEMCQQMKEHVYTVYERNSDEMQMKLQEISEVLDSCSKLNHELQEAVQALACLREGLATTQVFEP